MYLVPKTEIKAKSRVSPDIAEVLFDLRISGEVGGARGYAHEIEKEGFA
jgi:hypothetical protein